MNETSGFGSKLKKTFIGGARDVSDRSVFHKISLIAFFAWVGLGSDALTSSCYGPEEMFKTLGNHTCLAIFAGLLTVITIFVISTSYRQIINLFPNGGGGYIVASKLLSPSIGMISGCALLIDYVLTITLSISSGADAFFSFLPGSWLAGKLPFAFLILSLLIVLNLRGVRESVLTLLPVFVIFVVMHIILIGYGIFTHLSSAPAIVNDAAANISQTVSGLGVFGTILIVLRGYSMGAGTYTGIEAVSNGIPNLREPKTHTAQRTMMLMSVSLAIAAFGLIVSYYLFNVHYHPGKTLNAVLTENIVSGWNIWLGKSFLFLTLFSEAALLFVAAQTGFLDGPRVMANMAFDYWFPRRFMHLSDRLVSQNGIILMGGASFILLYFSKGSVSWLVILYSINVFITFSLSQLGMVKHWYLVRKEEKNWIWKMAVNGFGLILTLSILITVTILKFSEGGWITLLITTLFALSSFGIKRHYDMIRKEILIVQKEIKQRMPEMIRFMKNKILPKSGQYIQNNDSPTAVILVNGYNGFGVYSTFKMINYFETIYKNIVFVQIGIIDSRSFRGYDQVERLKESMILDLKKYEYIASQLGLHSDYYYSVGTDIVEEVDKLIPQISKKYPNTVFVGGQLIFDGNSFITRMLHNYTIFAIQRNLYKHEITTIVIPLSLDKNHYVMA